MMMTLSNFAKTPLQILQNHCATCLLALGRNVKIEGCCKVGPREVNVTVRSEYSTKSHTSTHSHINGWVKPTGYNTGINVYNTLTKQKDELVLPRGKHLSWYICGPTVYDSSHIGHASNYIRFDIIRRILQDFFDLNVVCLMGITDIDDKIIRRAQELEQDSTAITCHYERQFFQEMLALNMKAPTVTSRVTDNMPAILDFIQGIMNRGHAYKTPDGSVYFDVQKYGNYNKFVPPQLKTETAVKKSSHDFALWKAAKPGEPTWASPWGPGRPGWHIECSAMASRVFGPTIDLHSGGQDLVFPHHENELAQSCSYHDCNQWVNYWMHTGYLHLQHDPEKMSKSLKNTISTAEILAKYTANQFRMFCMLSNYRHNIEFTPDTMKKAVNLDSKIGNFLRQCEDYIQGHISGVDLSEADILQKIEDTKVRIHAAMVDDFRTSDVMDALIELIHSVSTKFTENHTQGSRHPGTVTAVAVYVKRVCKKLGFHRRGWKMSEEPDRMKLKEVLDHTVQFRWKVRQYAKNMSPQLPDTVPKKVKKAEKKRLAEPFYTATDELRTQFSHCNITVMDHNDYSSWEFTDSVDGSDESSWDSSDEDCPKNKTKNKTDTQSDTDKHVQETTQKNNKVSDLDNSLGKLDTDLKKDKTKTSIKEGNSDDSNKVKPDGQAS